MANLNNECNERGNESECDKRVCRWVRAENTRQTIAGIIGGRGRARGNGQTRDERKGRKRSTEVGRCIKLCRLTRCSVTGDRS